MPILGSFNSRAKKDMLSKIWKNGDSYLIELKTLWEKEKSLVMSSFSLFHNVIKNCLMLMRQNEYLWSERLKTLVCRGGGSNPRPPAPEVDAVTTRPPQRLSKRQIRSTKIKVA